MAKTPVEGGQGTLRSVDIVVVFDYGGLKGELVREEYGFD